MNAALASSGKSTSSTGAGAAVGSGSAVRFDRANVSPPHVMRTGVQPQTFRLLGSLPNLTYSCLATSPRLATRIPSSIRA